MTEDEKNEETLLWALGVLKGYPHAETYACGTSPGGRKFSVELSKEEVRRIWNDLLAHVEASCVQYRACRRPEQASLH